ncbi:acyltransferase [Pectinatus frisingensis]|uniref:acyltransferase n=1 Tax=Pectinatus frisingensis TaxID=865 RepID=UPI0018C481A8|nr:acyltransferase [Pectinatus frisingensis]
MQKKKCICGKNTEFFLESNVDNLAQKEKQINIGKNCKIRGKLLVYPYAGNIKIGNDCYIGEGTRIWSEKEIIIGNNVLIAHNVDIHDCNDHPINANDRHNHYMDIITKGHLAKYNLCGEKIIIGDNVWIGFGVAILKGVIIGQGAIVGAGAVVTKDVEPWTLVGGNPAKIIKKLEN